MSLHGRRMSDEVSFERSSAQPFYARLRCRACVNVSSKLRRLSKSLTMNAARVAPGPTCTIQAPSRDFIPPTLKTMVFGFIIGLVSCFQGMRTRGGTEGVGRSATSSVVLSSLFVVVADVLLVRLILTIWG